MSFENTGLNTSEITHRNRYSQRQTSQHGLFHGEEQTQVDPDILFYLNHSLTITAVLNNYRDKKLTQRNIDWLAEKGISAFELQVKYGSKV